MKKLLGLLAVAPMALAACSGNEADKPKPEAQTDLHTAYDNTNFLAESAKLDLADPATEQVDIDYNTTATVVNALLGIEASGDQLFEDNWSIENKEKVEEGGNTYDLFTNYILEENTLLSHSYIMVDGEAMETEYNIFEFTVANDKLSLLRINVSKVAAENDYTFSDENSFVSYSNKRLNATVKDSDYYLNLNVEDTYGGSLQALNTTSGNSVMGTMDSTGMGVNVHTHVTSDEQTKLTEMEIAIKIPGTDVTWHPDMLTNGFPEATAEYTYTELETKFA